MRPLQLLIRAALRIAEAFADDTRATATTTSQLAARNLADAYATRALIYADAAATIVAAAAPNAAAAAVITTNLPAAISWVGRGGKHWSTLTPSQHLLPHLPHLLRPK
ncbi:hypothetical protein PG993_013444 [Apiospora rasikravindrae]|uniref:Secreted protein n=1 Tax=Apiospora rasikravindrae TaxID=990691 RepID=A0ABR1RXM0_9PEZI